MKNILKFIFVVQFVVFATSCSKNHDAKIINYQITGSPATIDIDGHAKTVNVTFPSNVLTANPLTADFELSEGAVASVSNMVQVTGVTQNNYEMPFSYIT